MHISYDLHHCFASQTLDGDCSSKQVEPAFQADAAESFFTHVYCNPNLSLEENVDQLTCMVTSKWQLVCDPKSEKYIHLYQLLSFLIRVPSLK